MAAETCTPEVKAAHAFKEISLDFEKPAEIFREAIANSMDAYATTIWLRARVRPDRGKELVTIDMADDGIGMSAATIKRFLDLSDSEKPSAPPKGVSARKMTGYKGHGTKIFYNADELQVLTYDGQSSPVLCRVRDPRGDLHENKIPQAEISEISLDVFGDGSHRSCCRHSSTKTGSAAVHLKGIRCSFRFRWFSHSQQDVSYHGDKTPFC